MKKMPLLLVLLTFLSLRSWSQEKTGQVYFIRSTGYVGSALNYLAYLDDTLACKLKNKTYSVHTVPVGKHTVAVQDKGLSTHKKSTPFEIEVKEGQTTYVNIVWANQLSCEEITASSAAVKLKSVKQTTDCKIKSEEP